MFELETIYGMYDEMEEDSKIDMGAVVNYAYKLSLIHAKWNKRLVLYRMELIKFESAYNKIVNEKRVYYSGKAGMTIYKNKPLPVEISGIKLTKGDIDIIINADDEVIERREMYEIAKTLCESIHSFMFQISKNTEVVKVIHSAEKYDLMGV